MTREALSALARGVEGHALVKFAQDNGLPDDWCSTQITAMLSGNRLDNTNGATRYDATAANGVNHEYLVQLEGRGVCVVNLATVLAMATAFCRQQQELARSVVKDFKGLKKKGRSNNGGTAGTRRTARKSR